MSQNIIMKPQETSKSQNEKGTSFAFYATHDV